MRRHNISFSAISMAVQANPRTTSVDCRVAIEATVRKVRKLVVTVRNARVSLLALSKTEMNIDPLGESSFEAKKQCYVDNRT
jgi:hypothetical protein